MTGPGLPHHRAALRARASELADQVQRGDRFGDGMASVLLALVIGIVGAMLLVHWGVCSQEPVMTCGGAGWSALALLRLPGAAADRMTTGGRHVADAVHRMMDAWHYMRARARYLRAVEDADRAVEWIVEDQLLLADAQARMAAAYPVLQAADSGRRVPRRGVAR